MTIPHFTIFYGSSQEVWSWQQVEKLKCHYLRGSLPPLRTYPFYSSWTLWGVWVFQSESMFFEKVKCPFKTFTFFLCAFLYLSYNQVITPLEPPPKKKKPYFYNLIAFPSVYPNTSSTLTDTNISMLSAESTDIMWERSFSLGEQCSEKRSSFSNKALSSNLRITYHTKEK